MARIELKSLPANEKADFEITCRVHFKGATMSEVLLWQIRSLNKQARQSHPSAFNALTLEETEVLNAIENEGLNTIKDLYAEFRHLPYTKLRDTILPRLIALGWIEERLKGRGQKEGSNQGPQQKLYFRTGKAR